MAVRRALKGRGKGKVPPYWPDGIQTRKSGKDSRLDRILEDLAWVAVTSAKKFATLATPRHVDAVLNLLIATDAQRLYDRLLELKGREHRRAVFRSGRW